MITAYFGQSIQGDREENLDRYGHIVKGNWSISYLLDGYVICEPHYVDALENKLRELEDAPENLSLDEIEDKLSQAISGIIQEEGKASVVFVICAERKLVILSAGDTRAYLPARQQRTLDHSRAQQLVDQGKAHAETLHQHPCRRYLHNSLSNESKGLDCLDRIAVDNIEDIVLCSDGVWSCFRNDDEVYDALRLGGENLFLKAQENKPEGKDNMTILHLVDL